MYNVPHLRVDGKETLSLVFGSKRVVEFATDTSISMAQGTSETLLYANAQSTAEKTKEILKEHGL